MPAMQPRIKESWHIITGFEKLGMLRSRVKLKTNDVAQV
jgi:hypothetical protein